MSRIGKQPIQIPEKTEVVIEGNTITVRGPQGELKRSFPNLVSIDVKDNVVTVTPTKKIKTPLVTSLILASE